jgi:hypothetical protein
MGFVPDIIVIKCGSLREAAGAVEWTVLGPQLICMTEPKTAEHASWDVASAFEMQVFCDDGESFLVNRVTNSKTSYEK